LSGFYEFTERTILQLKIAPERFYYVFALIFGVALQMGYQVGIFGLAVWMGIAKVGRDLFYAGSE
jgi:hypothetical protein